MRHLSRVRRRLALAVARRRPPRWLRPALLGGTLGGFLLGFGGALAWAQHTGALAQWSQELQARLVAWSARAGLVIGEVVAEGRRHTGQAELVTALGVEIGQPILAVDGEALRHRLEALPWVSQASVVRELPDRLRVRLTERQPLALWQRQDGYLLVDRDGAVIPAPHGNRFAHLPLLLGDDAPGRAAGLFALLSIEPALMGRVTAAVLVGGRRWNLRLDHAIEVRLPEQGAERAWRLLAAKAARERLLERAVQVIDLRQPDRIIVRLRPEAIPARSGGIGA